MRWPGDPPACGPAAVAAVPSPLMIAHQWACLDYVSGGRAILGAGLGRDHHYRQFEVPEEGRVRRFREEIELYSHCGHEGNFWDKSQWRDRAQELVSQPAGFRAFKVDLNDDNAVDADKMFTILMGDVVEPRRQFIEDNALNVRNLDV